MDVEREVMMEIKNIRALNDKSHMQTAEKSWPNVLLTAFDRQTRIFDSERILYLQSHYLSFMH